MSEVDKRAFVAVTGVHGHPVGSYLIECEKVFKPGKGSQTRYNQLGELETVPNPPLVKPRFLRGLDHQTVLFVGPDAWQRAQAFIDSGEARSLDDARAAAIADEPRKALERVADQVKQAVIQSGAAGLLLSGQVAPAASDDSAALKKQLAELKRELAAAKAASAPAAAPKTRGRAKA